MRLQYKVEFTRGVAGGTSARHKFGFRIAKLLDMAQLVEDWYKQMPIITRSYLTLSVLTTAGCALEVFLLSVFFGNAFSSPSFVCCGLLL